MLCIANGGFYAASSLPLDEIRKSLTRLGAIRSVPALDKILSFVPESNWSDCWNSLVSVLRWDQAYDLVRDLDRQIVEEATDYFPFLVEFFRSHREQFPHCSVPYLDEG